MTWWIKATLNSYAQIFFSLNIWLAMAILATTLIEPFLGICGLFFVLGSNVLARLMRCPDRLIFEGMYGFNALLLGLALAHTYALSSGFLVLGISALLLQFLFTISLEQLMGRYGLPYLSLPFLLTYWLVYLSIGAFANIQLEESYVFTHNHAMLQANSWSYMLAHGLDNIAIPEIARSFFRTLSATFFQDSILAGMLIALGILIFSRIVFSLSVIGYSVAFLVFNLFGLQSELLTEHLVGSNFIFLAIALGGFYLVPSTRTYLLAIVMMPILCIFLISFGQLLAVYQLKAFTLSFTFLTILVLFVIHHLFKSGFKVVALQYYQPETTVYKDVNVLERFPKGFLAKFTLPFWGKWRVSQGYDGSITHLGAWKYALDFDIVGSDLQTYRNAGIDRKDFLCYDKPVVAPLDGFIYEVVNYVDENEINQVNTRENWGNTILINHTNGLFSQLSHLKKDSIKVRVGDFVKRGEILAHCGNSGRSPEPHIHFQVQSEPKIGATTLPYPIAYYIEEKDGLRSFQHNQVPEEGAIIENIEPSENLTSVLSFQPGRRIEITGHGIELNWTVYTDSFNRTYLHCPKSNATLWFVNDGILCYAYDYSGPKSALLFDFYLTIFKVVMSTSSRVKITDRIPVHYVSQPFLRVIQDFFAPFALVLSTEYTSVVQCDSAFGDQTIKIETDLVNKVFNRSSRKRTFSIEMKDKTSFSWYLGTQNKTYSCAIY